MKDVSFNKNSTMMNDFVIDGMWYLDGMEINEGVFGQLSYRSQEITLKLMGKFTDEYLVRATGTLDIYGFSVSGKHIYLQNCLVIKQQDNFPGMSIEYYTARTLFVSESKIKSEMIENISNFTVSFKDYENWNTSSPIQILQFPNKEVTSIQYTKEELKKMQRTYSLKKMNLEIMEIANIKNDFNKSFSEINITQKKSLFIKSLDNSIFSFEKFLENLNVINQMYSFFMGNQLSFKEVSFSTKNQEDEAIQVIKIYFPQRITFSNQRYLLDYGLVKESLPHIIEMFDKSYSSLEKILSGHLNSSFKNFFEVDDFLQASRNIEVFSRTFSNVKEKTPENYEEAKKELIEKLTQFDQEELTTYFLKKINYIGEISLSKKIRDMIRTIPEQLKRDLFSTPNRKLSKSITKFCQTVGETRNYYTHGDDINNYPNAVDSMKELHLVYNKLKCLIDILILKSLNLDESTIIKSIKRWDGPYQMLFY